MNPISKVNFTPVTPLFFGHGKRGPMSRTEAHDRVGVPEKLPVPSPELEGCIVVIKIKILLTEDISVFIGFLYIPSGAGFRPTVSRLKAENGK